MTSDVSTHEAAPASPATQHGPTTHNDDTATPGEHELDMMIERAPLRIGHYERREVIGRGGMGRVFRYQDTKLGRDVAIKFLLAPDGHAEALLREARAIAMLEHPNILKIHTADEVAGIPFLVAEYIQGTSLAEVTCLGSWPRVLRLAIGLARGLAAAHDKGIVHGDIKPANAVLDERNDVVKLIDFGLARYADGSATAEPSAPAGGARRHPMDGEGRTRGVPGTRRYMAPELRRGGHISKHSDVYAFGVTLYELCVAKIRLTRAGARPAVHRNSEPACPLMDDALVDIPPGLRAIIRRCLSAEPEYRYESARSLLRALQALSHPVADPYRGKNMRSWCG